MEEGTEAKKAKQKGTDILSIVQLGETSKYNEFTNTILVGEFTALTQPIAHQVEYV